MIRVIDQYLGQLSELPFFIQIFLQKYLFTIPRPFYFAMILSIIEVDFSKQNDNLGGVMLA